jgi:hypothetical protein
VVIVARERAPIGRAVATEALPAGPHEFHFWTANDAALGIGAIVRVDGEADRVVYAVVIDGRAYSDVASPMHDVMAAEGKPDTAAAPTRRAEIRLWTAAVLRHVPEEPVQPVPLTAVYAASAEDVETALRMDTYLRATPPAGIPIGVYQAGGMSVPVALDAAFVMGPESAHLNISGVSGLATKTSAIEFMLASIFQRMPAEKGSVAAVCFNVKGPDLCFLDQPAELSDEDRALYDVVGVEPRPFEHVEYYAPFKADGVNLNTLRTHPEVVDGVQPLVWGLRGSWTITRCS